MRESESMKCEIMTIVKKATVPHQRVIYACAYAVICNPSGGMPTYEVHELPGRIERLLRSATSRELCVIRKCAYAIVMTK